MGYQARGDTGFNSRRKELGTRFETRFAIPAFTYTGSILLYPGHIGRFITSFNCFISRLQDANSYTAKKSSLFGLLEIVWP